MHELSGATQLGSARAGSLSSVYWLQVHVFLYSDKELRFFEHQLTCQFPPSLITATQSGKDHCPQFLGNQETKFQEVVGFLKIT